MKMPAAQSSENDLFEYENGLYYGDNPNNVNNTIDDYASPPEDVFSEYLWMENEEEFDREVMQRLEEEALMEECIEAMLDDETPDLAVVPGKSLSESAISKSANEVSNLISNLKIDSSEVIKGSNLNPLAAEFIPVAHRSVDKST